MSRLDDKWRVWDRETEYGRLLYQRATGELPEMESSKAMARQVKTFVSPGDRILDVGCGVAKNPGFLRRFPPFEANNTEQVLPENEIQLYCF